MTISGWRQQPAWNSLLYMSGCDTKVKPPSRLYTSHTMLSECAARHTHTGEVEQYSNIAASLCSTQPTLGQGGTACSPPRAKAVDCFHAHTGMRQAVHCNPAALMTHISCCTIAENASKRFKSPAVPTPPSAAPAASASHHVTPHCGENDVCCVLMAATATALSKSSQRT